MKRLTVVLTALIAAPSAILMAGTATAPAEAASGWGHASAPDQTIKGGCADYRFRYDVTAPGDEWMAELTLVNPNGRKVSTRTYDSAEESATGAGTFALCKATTSAGKYLIRMKVTSYDARDASSRQVEPAAFRLASQH